MNLFLPHSLASIGFFVLFITPQANAQQDPAPINLDPKLCSECIEIKITPKKPTSDPIEVGPNLDGSYTVTVSASNPGYGGTPCNGVTVVELYVTSADRTQRENVVNGVATIPSSKATGHPDWVAVAKCNNNGTPKEERFKLGRFDPCAPEAENGSFTYTIPLGKGDAGETSGTLRFFTVDFENPGISALYASVPVSYVVKRDSNGRIQSVDTGAAIITVAASPTDFDPNAFTVTHPNPVDSENPYRTTTISLVNDGGAVRLRADNRIQGTTYRHEQTRPQAGTLILESGRVDGVAFNALRKETHIVQKPVPTTEIQRDIVEERVSTEDTYVKTSEVLITWKEFIWGWEKVEEVIDPGGAALTSTWSFYEPGDFSGPDAATDGLGRLKSHTRYDGHQEFHTYWLHHHLKVSPYAGDPQGLSELESYHPQSATRTVTRSVGGNIISRTSETYDKNNNRRIHRVSTSGEADLLTVTEHVPDGVVFGGLPVRIIRPDDTMTTYSYTPVWEPASEPGVEDRLIGKTIVMEEGAGDGTSVTQGTRTTSNYNRYGTLIRQVVEAIGYGTGSAAFSHMAVTDLDSLGRPLTTTYFPSSSTITGDVSTAVNPAWTTTVAYSCCGVSQDTDMYGIPTFYAYDHLRRKIKSNRLGVTTETVYRDLTTETHRYPEVVTDSLSPALQGTSDTLVSRSVRNLAGTTNESYSPDPTSLTDGALVMNRTTTTYQPATGLSSRAVTLTPDSFTQTTDSYLDGRTAATYGDLGPHMAYSYAANAVGETSSESYVDNGALRETTTTTSDWAGRQVRVDYMDGAFATNEYNAQGQLLKSTDPDEVVTLYAYNTKGERTVSAVDLPEDENTPPNGIIDFGIDTVQFSETIPALDGGKPVYFTTSKVWQPGDTNSSAGNVTAISTRSADGLTSSGQSIGVANPSTNATLLGGNGSWTTTTTNPDGTKTLQTYAAGRLVSSAIQDSSSSVIQSASFQYDGLGRQTGTTDFRTGATNTAYLSNTADVTKSVTDPGNRTTAFEYDIRGHQIKVTLPDDTVTSTTYTPRGELASRSGSQTYPVSYTYDYAGRQATMTTYGTEEATTTWEYSAARGSLTRKEYDDDNGTDYTYTDAGRLLTRAWQRGVTTTYGYDNGGRLTSTTYSDGTPSVSITYDALGRQLTQSNGLAQSSYTYNPGNLQIDTETIEYDLDPGTPGFEFTRILDRSQDALGRDTGWNAGTFAQYQAGWVDGNDDPDLENAVTYGYGSTDGRLATVSGGGLQPPSQFIYAYTANSNLLATVTGPEHIVTNIWEATRNVLASKENDLPGGTLSKFTYSINDLGQRVGLTPTGSAFATTSPFVWGYNDRGELTSATRNGLTAFERAYSYDGIGNRLTATDHNAATTSYFADTTGTAAGGNVINQYEKIEFPGSATIQPVHDADGNMTSGPVPGANGLNPGVPVPANSTLTWDAENRLVKVVVNSTTVEYDYDPQSRLISRTTGTTTTRYLYDGWNRIAEYENNGTGHTLKTSYLWGMDLSGSMQGAGGVGGLLSMTMHGTTPATFYPTYDGNGNISEYVNQSGVKAAHFEYDPFGNLTIDSENNASQFPYRFSTKPQDLTTGLLYYGYRWLDPATGRWPSRDPIEENGGYNLYGFVGNDGVNGIDELGLALYSFDGTANVPDDNTNVWLMRSYYSGAVFYESGIGNSEEYSIFTQLIRQATGWGLTAKRDKMLSNLKSQIEAGDLDVDVIGFSRGAVTAIAFAEAIEKLKKEKVSPYCKLSKIRFMGLYDPVPGPTMSHRPSIPSFVSNTSIAYALDEKRTFFATKVYSGNSVSIRGFRGGHSDIGGGYPANERGLADISFSWMTNEGISAGAPFGLAARPVSQLIRHQEVGASSFGSFSDRNLQVPYDSSINNLVFDKVLKDRRTIINGYKGAPSRRINGGVNKDEILYKWR
jgi:RHS repeat-associated protein